MTQDVIHNIGLLGITVYDILFKNFALLKNGI